MDSNAVKFLLNLLSFPNYRAPISHVKPTPKMQAAARNKICRELCDRDLVACSEQIKTLRISQQGKTWLKSAQLQGELTLEELKVLQACLTEKISPGKTGLPADSRLKIIADLARRDLLVLEQEIDEVWLTETGQKFLIQEYDPREQSGNIPFNMLADYLRLVHQFYQQPAPRLINHIPNHIPGAVKATPIQPSTLMNYSDNFPINELDILQTIRQLDIHLGALKETPTERSTKLPSDEDILQLISQLDRELGTENYLPIFHLREKLQSLLGREEVDQALYRLQDQDKIQLKSLEEVLHYSPEYFEAAIPQEKAWSLFFIVRTYPSKKQISGEDEDDRKGLINFY